MRNCDFQENLNYKVGVDIGGTKILMVVADPVDRIIFREKMRSSTEINEVIQVIALGLQKTGIPNNKIAGIGVGIPGRVDTKKGIVLDSPSLKWRELPFQKIVSDHFLTPVYVANDVNLAVIGERWFGGVHSDNIFYLAVGTGVGSAIFMNGAVIEGADFSAGEIGYFIDKEDVLAGRKNQLLEFGTFEMKSSGTALAAKGMKFHCSPEKLFQEYQLNNPQIMMIMHDFVMELSIALANVISLLNPEVVVIGGGVAGSMDCIIDEIRAQVGKYTPIQTKIELSKLGGEAGALGGIAYINQMSSYSKKGRVVNEGNEMVSC